MNPKFHTARDSAERRESDVIWRLPTREGADVYLYLLLEFQSASDWWMAVRTQVYQDLGELSRLFAELVAPAISRIGTQADVPHDLLEMKSMLATRGAVWIEELLAEGRAAGKAESLVRLLTARFGALPPAVRKGIGAADLATLERWFDHAIEASDLPSVFRRDPAPSVEQGNLPTRC